MKYFITGHTGFKGAWLSVMLSELGHELHGYSLDPEPNSIFEKAEIASLYASDIRGDIRDYEKLRTSIAQVDPDVVIHLAAQALVLESFRKPKDTFETNFNGTLNLLASLATLTNLKAALIITTDKVYAESSKPEGCSEDDPLGGLDPYSASKAAADLLTQSWAKCNTHLPIAIARAGNVIGGGDRSPDRLIPDLIRAFSANETARIRSLSSVRPWQHVMDCLFGYLLLTDSIIKEQARGEWNFGPEASEHLTVSAIVKSAAALWSPDASWVEVPPTLNRPESLALRLDVRKAKRLLNFATKMTAEQAVEATVNWEREVMRGVDATTATRLQVRNFLDLTDTP